MTETNRDLSVLDLPTYVNTRKEDVIEILYKPCLRASKRYVRGAGYFRSSVFRLMTEDLLDFCIRGGTITLLTSTEWGRQDYETTMKAYEDYKENGIKEDLLALLEDPNTLEPTRMLCALIQNGNLDLRVGVLRGDIYHQKKGYFEDEHGNIVAFDGSGNETLSALKPYDEGNAESFNIGWNWNSLYWNVYAKLWKEDLDQTMDPNQDSTFPVVSVVDLDPEFIGKWDIETDLEAHRDAARERQKMMVEKWDEVWGGKIVSNNNQNTLKKKIPEWSSEIIDNEEMWRVHQKGSLKEWKKKEKKGVLEHATGSGKTITSLIAIKEHTDQGNNAIVLVPSQPLLEQWDEEFEEHLPGVTRALLGSGNQGKDILSEMRVSGGSVLISTMQSFRNEEVLRKVERLLKGKKSNLMLVVDECHRIGAPSYVELCKMKFPVTLGLSATPERQRDEEGTSRIFQLLGPVIHRFTLEDAMEAKLLSKFEYHVKEAALTTKEQKKYDELRRQIKKWFARWKNSGTEMPESLEIMIFKSRSIIRNAENKISEAVEIINSNYEKEQHWLVYCGEGMMDEIDLQITAVMGEKPLRYWSGMNRFQRKESLSQFKAKGGIMLAIKCLDEGVDIPAISHGVVLSSSKTKREWIQRRGRLLRKSPGKKQSVIYDVLAFPDAFGDETNFVMDEVKRAFEFSKSCENAAKTQADLSRIMTAYNISEEDLVSDYERPEEDENDE
jgi:superfamily II DNA or RNA helicase